MFGSGILGLSGLLRRKLNSSRKISLRLGMGTLPRHFFLSIFL
jgi:hypothetical protein